MWRTRLCFNPICVYKVEPHSPEVVSQTAVGQNRRAQGYDLQNIESQNHQNEQRSWRGGVTDREWNGTISENLLAFCARRHID